MMANKFMTAAFLLGDTKFSDAKVVMGDHTWMVHRWVLCMQSAYFMTALEGQFVEAQDKTIDLTGSPFSADDISAMLKFLYTNELTVGQDADPIATFAVADYFQVNCLRQESLASFEKNLQTLIDAKFWRNYRKQALKLQGPEWEGRDPEGVLVRVTARNCQAVLNDSGIWDDIVQVSPGFADKVLRACFPKPQRACSMPLKRSASNAFNDAHRRSQGGGRYAGDRFAKD